MTEAEQLRRLTPQQRRKIAGYACAWCDQPAEQAGCGAMFGKCSEASRCAKRQTLLEELAAKRTDKAKESR